MNVTNTARPNKSLDRSAGSVFRNLIGAAKIEGNRRARSTRSFARIAFLERSENQREACLKAAARGGVNEGNGSWFRQRKLSRFRRASRCWEAKTVEI
jgi:hypothetical protein